MHSAFTYNPAEGMLHDCQLEVGTEGADFCRTGAEHARQYLTVPFVKVSPEAHSTPNMATMSPAVACEMSSKSLACMRTKRGTYSPTHTLVKSACNPKQ